MGKKAVISLPEHKIYDPMDVVEMDELYTFVKKTLKTRIWTAVDRNEKRLTAFEVEADSLNFKQINLKSVCTDGNFSHDEGLGINADIKYIISKSETCLVLRYYLARLHRKTKCYSKSIQMLELSIALFLHRRMLLC